MPRYFEFEVSLLEIEPRIWRRFLIKEDSDFYDLHLAIQRACGWGNYHMFLFSTKWRKGQEIAGIPSDNPWGPPTPDAGQIPLCLFFRTGRRKKCIYTYDFGDNWMHEVQMNKIVEDPDVFHRRLVAGERAFPPEDCGGVGGYYRCLETLDPNTTDEDVLEFREWMGDWDPEAFDLNAMKKTFDG